MKFTLRSVDAGVGVGGAGRVHLRVLDVHHGVGVRPRVEVHAARHGAAHRAESSSIVATLARSRSRVASRIVILIGSGAHEPILAGAGFRIVILLASNFADSDNCQDHS